LRFHIKNTFYVGDTRNDYLAANKCNVKFIYAKYGYGKKTFKAFATINKFKDILKLDFS
jgi:phosphoglycolate phosphatase-like HAD superfamily hydrolase